MISTHLPMNGEQKDYYQIGHGIGDKAWVLHNDDNILVGNSHAKIVQNYPKEFRNDIVKSIGENWAGRFDSKNGIITASILKNEKEGPYIGIPPHLIPILAANFQQYVGEPATKIINILTQRAINLNTEQQEPHIPNPEMIKELHSSIASAISMIKVASKNFVSEHESILVPDIDRYISDDYAINVALQETDNRYSVGIYITNYKVGISGYQQYWHYKKDEYTEARQTYNQIHKIVKGVATMIVERAIPHPLIKPFVRKQLNTIDMEHKEKSGIPVYNWYTTEAEKADDWRDTIYGGRYPNQTYLEPMNYNWNEDEKGKTIKTQGSSSRNTTYRYCYDSDIKTAEVHEAMNPFHWLGDKKNRKAVLPALGLAGTLALGTPTNTDKEEPQPEINSHVIIPKNEHLQSITPPTIEQKSKETETQRKNRARGDRNNNPGNIDRNNIKWQGMADDQSGDDRFIIFEYPQDGIRAMSRILKTYQRRYNLYTINDIIAKWAPTTENNTNAYTKYVTQQVRINANDHINLNDNNLMFKIIRAMIQYENGYQPYSDDVIMEGIEAEQTGDRSWANAKEMQQALDHNKIRSKHPPRQFVQPFDQSANDTKQHEIVNKGASFVYAFEQIEEIKARRLLAQVIDEVGWNWKDIASTLKKKYKVSNDKWMSFLHKEFLQFCISRMSSSKHRYKYTYSYPL